MWSQSGNSLQYINNPNGILEKLHPAIYVVEQNPITGQFFLTYRTDRFSLPSTIYNFNSTSVKSDLSSTFLDQYNKQSNNLGILLSGVKGTGKSLLLKQTANKALEHNLPVILVEESFNSEALAKYLASIEEPLAILFDEFEKKYSTHSDDSNYQNGLLSLFDGTSSTHNLFVLTANDLLSVSPLFINRPSRIRYNITYSGLSEDFTHEFLTTHLTNPETIEPVFEHLVEIDELNFDTLNTVVNEVNNLYPTESVSTILNILNLSLTKDNYIYYDVTLYVDNEPVSELIHSIDFTDFTEEGFFTTYLPHHVQESLSSFPNVLTARSQNVTFLKGRNLLEVTYPDLSSNTKAVFRRIRNKHVF